MPRRTAGKCRNTSGVKSQRDQHFTSFLSDIYGYINRGAASRRAGREIAFAKASTKPWFQWVEDKEAFHISKHGKLNTEKQQGDIRSFIALHEYMRFSHPRPFQKSKMLIVFFNIKTHGRLYFCSRAINFLNDPPKKHR